jgi:hypothetical protein
LCAQLSKQGVVSQSAGTYSFARNFGGSNDEVWIAPAG